MTHLMTQNRPGTAGELHFVDFLCPRICEGYLAQNNKIDLYQIDKLIAIASFCVFQSDL